MSNKKDLPPVKAIREWCKRCQSGSLKLIRECETTDCPLWIYRMGKNPNRKGIGGRKKRSNDEPKNDNEQN